VANGSTGVLWRAAGRGMAGLKSDPRAGIFSVRKEAELLRIIGCYGIAEDTDAIDAAGLSGLGSTMAT